MGPSTISHRQRFTSTLSPRPANWKSQAPAPLPGTTTFAGQATLPKLPVPELSDTLAKLKDSLKPIAWSDKEFNEAVAKIDEFGEGLGKELQARLLKRRDETVHWFEEWWDDIAYLPYRDSVSFPPSPEDSKLIIVLLAQVVINVSYYCECMLHRHVNYVLSGVRIDGFDEHPAHLDQSAISRAAALTRATMQFRELFKRGQVKPEAVRDGPLCMDTWR